MPHAFRTSGSCRTYVCTYVYIYRSVYVRMNMNITCTSSAAASRSQSDSSYSHTCVRSRDIRAEALEHKADVHIKVHRKIHTVCTGVRPGYVVKHEVACGYSKQLPEPPQYSSRAAIIPEFEHEYRTGVRNFWSTSWLRLSAG